MCASSFLHSSALFPQICVHGMALLAQHLCTGSGRVRPIPRTWHADPAGGLLLLGRHRGQPAPHAAGHAHGFSSLHPPAGGDCLDLPAAGPSLQVSLCWSQATGGPLLAPASQLVVPACR